MYINCQSKTACSLFVHVYPSGLCAWNCKRVVMLAGGENSIHVFYINSFAIIHVALTDKLCVSNEQFKFTNFFS